MSFLNREPAAKSKEEPAVEVAGGARLVPRITIQAFCENSQTAQLVESTTHDRRMSKVALTTHNGGLEGAIETYKSNPTPNLVIIETMLPPDQIPAALFSGPPGTGKTLAASVLATELGIALYRVDLSPSALAQVLSTKPVKAVIATHLYGQLADMAAITDLCRAAGVALIEDCAQAHGARRAGRLAGAWGDVACFSFYPTKNLGALGDGGAVVTDNAELANRVRALRQYGWGNKYEVVCDGGRNSRLDELQAAVLSAKLPLLDTVNAQRRAIGARYSAALADLPLRAHPVFGDDHVAHLYVVRSAQRQQLRDHLDARGIASDVHYPIADHRQPVHLGAYAGEHLPVTEAACQQALTLPCFPGMTDAQVEQVIFAVREFFKG